MGTGEQLGIFLVGLYFGMILRNWITKYVEKIHGDQKENTPSR